MNRNTDSEQVTALANKLHKKGLATPALFFLEAHLPCTKIFHTLFLFSSPMLTPFFGLERLQHYEALLSKQENIEALIDSLESLARQGST